MVQVLFIGMQRNSEMVMFGAAIDGSFVIRELGTLAPSPGSGLVLDRHRSVNEVEITDWSDTEMMGHIEELTDAGFELIGTPMVVVCPEMPMGWDEHIRWAERFIDDGLGLYVTGSTT